jgi:hypothetical protein
MDVISIAIEAWSPCPGCRQAIPLNCVGDGTQCAACGRAFPTPVDFWQKALQDALAQATGRGDGHAVSHMVFGPGGDPIGVIQALRTAARCHPSCNEPLPVGDFLEGARTTGWGRCFKCGGWLPSRAAFPWLRSIVPAARAIVSEIPPGQQAPQPGPHRWYVLLEESATATLPTDGREFCDFAASPQGNLLLAYHEERRGGSESPFVIAAVATTDGTSRILWENRQLEFSEDAWLLGCPGDGSCALVDPKQNFIAVFDPATGNPLRMLRGEPPSQIVQYDDDAKLPEPRPICVYEVPINEVTCDVDGSFLILTNWRDGKWRSLRRFAANGAPMPLWGAGGAAAPPAKKKGGLGALFGGGKSDDDDSFDDRDDWDKMKDRPEKLPNGKIFLHVGYDGVLWVLDHEKFVRIARDGRIVGRGAVPKYVGSIYDVSADRSGTLYLSIEHKIESRGRQQNFLRLAPDGAASVWLGPQAPPGGAFTSEYDRHVKAMPDGTLFVGRDFHSLRMIAPDRRSIWTAPITVTKDREEQQRF